MKTKVIRGTAIYMYRGSQYVEVPDNMYINKMVYIESENVTYCYMKKKSILLEILCSIVVICCIVTNILVIKDNTETIYYSSVATYYNGNLYLNLKSKEGNMKTFNYSIVYDDVVVTQGVVLPGSSIITVAISEPKDYYDLVIEYKNGFLPVKRVMKLQVDNKDILED